MKRVKLFLVMVLLGSMVFAGSVMAADEIRDLGEITIVLPDWGANLETDEDKYVKEEIERRLLEDRNIKLDINFKVFAPGSGGNNYKQRLNVMFASGEEIDAFNAWSGFIMQLATKPGLLMGVDELVEKKGPNIQKAYNQAVWNATKANGKYRFIPGTRLDVQHVLHIRKDLLEKAGVDIPGSIAELEEAFAKFDEMGYIPYIGHFWPTDWMFAAEFGIPVPRVTQFGAYVNDEGKVDSIYLTENFLNYLDMRRKWVKNGWLPEEHLTYNNNQMQNMFLADKVATFCYGTGTILQQNTLKEIAPEAEIEAVVLLASGKRAALGSIGSSIGIPRKSGNSEAVIEYWDWVLSDPDNMMLVERGIEGKHYKLNRKTKEFQYIGKYKNPDNRYNGIYSFQVHLQPLHGYVESSEIKEYTDTVKKLYALTDEQKIINPFEMMSLDFSDKTKNIINDLGADVKVVRQKYTLGDISKEEFKAKQKEWAEKWEQVQGEFQKAYNKISQ